ncbi:low molecular weight protein-tyrosine-phosphatase [Thalassobacillus devorans]|uniref:low molecular weight protein-tyrosine-phosphatase n=1 Tax=Thalassobacillus devorans TaxID=279813 RepID=UPI00048E61EF|nr:low molecular weight protein-tyrosine-phosphatase [Thalassobacillus devorans]
MIKVLFVCLGNICRSPMAEAIFRDLVKKEDLEKEITVDSAGVGHWHVGDLPHEGTRGVLDRYDISYEGMAARQIHEKDWDEFDYLIAMDAKNITDMAGIRKSDEVTVARLLDFIPDSEVKDVPDPFFTGNFEYVYELISTGCRELLFKIKQEQHLSKEE